MGAKPQYTDQEKAEIVERVCAMYETQHCTVATACEAAGITDRSFRLWVNDNSEFSERYKKAKAKQQVMYWQEIVRPLADTALVRLLKGETTKQTRTKGERKVSIGEDGRAIVEFVATERIITENEIPPNPAAVIFTNKGIYPEIFTDRTQAEVKVTGDDWFKNLPLEKRVQILAIIEETEKEQGAEPS